MTASSATTTTDDDGERAVGLQWCREVFSAKSRTKAIAINGMCFIGRLRCLFSWPVIFYGYFTSWLLTFCSGRELTHTDSLGQMISSLKWCHFKTLSYQIVNCEFYRQVFHVLNSRKFFGLLNCVFVCRCKSVARETLETSNFAHVWNENNMKKGWKTTKKQQQQPSRARVEWNAM